MQVLYYFPLLLTFNIDSISSLNNFYYYKFHFRELSFRKNDILFLLRQVDKNWFEGERHGLVGIFPVNYVEVRIVFLWCFISLYNIYLYFFSSSINSLDLSSKQFPRCYL